MTDYYFVVQTNAVEGHEQEFSDWYTNDHLNDVLSVPGIVAAQRFELSGVRNMAEGLDKPFQFLAIYEIEGDFEDAFVALTKARQNWHLSEYMAENKLTCVYKPITERRTS
ncbi:hypothetical protein [Parasphingorhabdus sp.]|uniref:hypothetical protein n=1 Tax=Parasphingorhabdus sp. TaxID=2709688 RepID=UPI003A936E23